MHLNRICTCIIKLGWWYSPRRKKSESGPIKISRPYMTDILSDSLIVSLMIVKETDGIFGKETDVI